MTEKDVSYSKIVALIRKQINQVRVNPLSLSGYLNSKKIRFDKSEPLMFYPLKKTKQLCIKTKQGFKGTYTIQKRQIAVQQLDNFLLKQSTCQQLKWSYEIHLIAHKKAYRLAKSEGILQPRDIVQEILEITDENKRISHIMKQIQKNNPQKSTQKSQRPGYQFMIDEEYVITYFGVIDPKQLVSNLLIDDGFLKRQHRKALLNKRMNHIGIGIHQHPTQYFVVVIIMANHIKQVETGLNLSEAPSCDCKII